VSHQPLEASPSHHQHLSSLITNDEDTDYDHDPVEPNSTPEKHFFDVHLRAESGSDLESLIRSYNSDLFFQQATQRADWLANNQEVMSCLIANLAVMVSQGAEYVVVPKASKHYDKASVYKSSLVSKNRLNHCLKRLEECSLVSVIAGEPWSHANPSNKGAKATEVRLSDVSLSNQLQKIDASRDVIQSDDFQTIVLKSAPVKTQDWRSVTTTVVRPKAAEYPDNADIIRYRGEMFVINDHMSRSDIVYLGSHPCNKVKVKLRRIFCYEDFTKCGRLYGHYLQNVPGEERGHVRIQGHKVVDMDYSTMHLRLLYARAGVPLPAGDPFAIPGCDRATVKKAVYAILNAIKPLSRAPKDLKGRLPVGLTWPKLCAMIFERLPLVKEHAYQGIGLELMFLESQILVEVLSQLVKLNIGFIPMHDGLLVPEPHAEIVGAIMVETYKSLVHEDIKITRKYH
jgi:hypothetical protein